MKVTVIGCGTTWSERATSSYCINNNILVDAGEGTLKNYKKAKVDFFAIKHIFITHLHTDHTTAIFHHIYDIACKREHDNNFERQLFVYGPKGTKKYFKKMIDLIMTSFRKYDFSSFLHIEEISDFNKQIEVENLKITPFKLKHGNLIDIGYVFEDEKTSVGFSGDCILTKNLENFVKTPKNLFLECCVMQTDKSHLGYNDYIKFTKKYPNKNFLAIHCPDKVYNSAKKLKIKLAKECTTYYFEDWVCSIFFCFIFGYIWCRKIVLEIIIIIKILQAKFT